MARYRYHKKQDEQLLRAEIHRLRTEIRSLRECGMASTLPARSSSHLFVQMFERHAAAMLLIDPLRRMIVDANQAAAIFYGYPREVLRGMSVDHINAQPESEVAPQRQLAISGAQKHFVFNHRLASGAIRCVETHISTIEHDGQMLFFSIIHDITERKLADEQIRALAFHDPLTQLPNRRLLYDRLAHTMAASKRNNQLFALMLLDLDRFKPLNDTYGHAAGDRLLLEVARRIRECIRDMDTLARFGGDEFVIILDHLGSDPALAAQQSGLIAERILGSLNRVFQLPLPADQPPTACIECHCSTSIGIVVTMGNAPNADDILRQADSAMYLAKAAGGNRLRFHDPERSTGPS